MSQISKLKDLVTIVTGGASGLGLGTVERFVKQGAKVVICDLPESNGKKLQKTLGENVLFVPTDVTSENDVKSALKATKSKFGRLDVAVNCAGVGLSSASYDHRRDQTHSLEAFKKVMNVNAAGVFNMACLASRMMYENEPSEGGQRGVIINASSIEAFDGRRGQAASAASNAAISGMTLPVMRDLAYYGIRFMTIAPGLFDTPSTSKLPDNAKEFYASTIPFPSRFGHPDEFAHLVQSIVENPMLNGSTIRLDGALRHMP